MHGVSPGRPAAKSHPSNAGAEGLVPNQGARIPHALQVKKEKEKTKTSNRSNVVTDSVKTLK